MQEAEEQDTCRICSAPAEPDQPLFHPCRCSGTIRYIHQDCLTTWLAHSKKKTCDVCKHQYAFTKVYAADMPSRLPAILMAKRLLQSVLYTILLALRAVTVLFVWLALVPLIIVWSWRMYFSMGETTAWWISNRSHPSPSENIAAEINPFNPLIQHLLEYYPTFTNSSAESSSVPDTPVANATLNSVVSRTINHPVWIALSSDIFTGQIIASLIVIVFVAIFLLREWIAQNARPGIFDDNDDVQVAPRDQVLQVPPAPAPPAAPPAAGDEGQDANRENGNLNRQVMDLNARLALARQQLEAMRALDELREYDRDARERARERRERREQGLEGEGDTVPVAVQNGRSALEFAPIRDEARNEELDRYAAAKARMRRGKELVMEAEVRAVGDVEDENLTRERKKRRNFARRLEQAKNNGARRRNELGGLPAVPGTNGKDSAEGSSGGISSTVPSPSSSGSHAGSPQSPFAAPSFFPDVILQRPTSSIPFSITPKTSPSMMSPASASASASASSSAPPDILGNGADNTTLTSSSVPSTSTQPLVQDIPIPILTPVKRPPLPTTTLPVSTSPTATFSQPSTPLGVTKAKTPLASPSLATYRPPEELDDLDEGGYFAVGPAPKDANAKDASDDEEQDLADEPEGEGDEETLEDELDAEMSEQEMEKYFGEADEDRPEVWTETEDEGEDGVEGVEGEEHIQLDADAVQDVDDEDDDDDEVEDEIDIDSDGDGDGDENVVRHRRNVLQGGRARARARALAAAQGVPAPGDPNAQGAMNGPLPAGAGQQDDEVLGLADDLEGNVEDDMEGAMEAIGMRGPLHGILQNAALMIFVLDTAIGVGVWIPFTIGKCTALLSLDPYRALHILHLPIRAIRLVTDPIVDSVVYIITDLLAPPYIRIAKKLFEWWIQLTFFIIGSALGQVKAEQAKDSCLATYSLMVDLVQRPMEIFTNGLTSATPQTPPPVVLPTEMTPAARAYITVMDAVEPYFAPLGKEIRFGSLRVKDSWTQLALGHGPLEKAFSVSLGYVMVALIIALYLNILTVGNVKTAGKAVRSAVRQQLLVLKVATFIFIELVVFPLGCGLVLDLCTVWLFPEANLASRMVFFYQAPLTAMFYHWVAGTMFMYSFAVLLSGCRTVMRPGAMWFIKDPQDQNSHPIRDILDRPTLVQMRKICVSALMYSFVVACTVGSISGLLILGSKSILPFRWKTREPLSSVPVDLIFLHLVLPYTMNYFRPRKALKKFATKVWQALAKRLRLTSYFFGGRWKAEEYTPKTWSLKRLLNLGAGAVEDAPVNPAEYDGTFRRVPATDHIALPREMRATADVDFQGKPVSEAAASLMLQQDMEAHKAKRNPKDDYLIVYIPPSFRYRIISFIALLWSIGALCLGLGVAIPIQLGRAFFNLTLGREVHDGYSIIAGFYLLWGCWIIGRNIDKLDKRRQRKNSEGPRAALWWLVVKRGLLWLVKASFLAFFLGVVLPALIGIAVELYFVLPIKLALQRTSISDMEMTVPKLRIVECWAMGLLYMNIALKAARRPQRNTLSRGIQRILTNGWSNPDPVLATKEVIGPVTIGLTAMILLPGLLFAGLQALFPVIREWVADTFIFTHLYPGIFSIACVAHGFLVSGDLMSTWSQSVRDKEFLVEMRLKNHEPKSEEKSKDKNAADLKGKGKGKEKAPQPVDGDNKARKRRKLVIDRAAAARRARLVMPERRTPAVGPSTPLSASEYEEKILMLEEEIRNQGASGQGSSSEVYMDDIEENGEGRPDAEPTEEDIDVQANDASTEDPTPHLEELETEIEPKKVGTLPTVQEEEGSDLGSVELVEHVEAEDEAAKD
ncbi:hypothetical protein D9758_008724 [Tetrapyrgos nigripes]|uniref:RING-type E3 ubiquitin transferase n=1 Tax=Tetrapyrgos nigripes TaxID=182062 RepID=A0A8H5D5J6_9AGAR|nr:hypothetical protein D9758_008724 [Tetrapyrgos nigripes]